MQKLGLNEIRSRFLEFFESKNHLVLPSSPLVPIEDKSMLIINSGMAPFKPYFSGEKTPPNVRMASCQKCVRATDIENVGKTSRHGTFFEMLGNFSIGDYFKREALAWTWEFLTVTLEIPENLLFPSVYIEDDEAFDIWTKEIGLPESKVTRLGKYDNFWELGVGPCGPCSEVYYDRGEENGCGSPDCRPGCDCDRFIEIWNNVFTQFNSDGKGNYTPLAKKNIDTGMGLERMAIVMQGVSNIMEVDTIKATLDKVCEITSVKYLEDAKKDVSIRIITDHIRSATFMISDNIMPSNEGRGYVLRRVLRRAARHGKLLGMKTPFLYELCDIVIEISGEAYPNLVEKKDYIKRILKTEEDRFDATIDSGLSILEEMIAKTKAQNETVLSAENTFKLYDTFGFPYDLTKEICEEQGLSLDDDGFDVLMKEQRERARAARADIAGWKEDKLSFLKDTPATEFIGYSELECEAKILHILVADEDNNFNEVESINEGEFTLIFDKTPFYAESGGQVGDWGCIFNSKYRPYVTVNDCKKTHDGKYLHMCKITDGTLEVGETVKVSVHPFVRNATAKNHTAAHLLQAALRKVLGTHVEQAGSYVDSNRVRFDFTHFSALTDEELKSVEGLVNGGIREGLDVTTAETDITSAKEMGAIALFGEKYGDVVRVVRMGVDHGHLDGHLKSIELCGGTHIDNTAKVGAFKIISETSVAAGVRRIEGTTAFGVLEMLNKDKELIDATAKVLKINNPADIAKKADSLNAELRAAKKEIEHLNSKLALLKVDSLVNSASDINGVKLSIAKYADINAEAAKMICETIKEKNPCSVSVIITISDDNKFMFTSGSGKEAVKKGANSGNIVKQLAQITGGNGGGRPDTAACGGKDISLLDAAIEKCAEIVTAMIK